MVRKTASIRRDHQPLLWLLSLLTLGAALLLARPAASQEWSAAELEDLVAPVALYPDDVLGIILPASTFPLDIVRAARFLDDREDDPSLEPDPEWDDSVVALLNYPEVLRMMDEDIDWTWELGEAVITDQGAVLEAAQNFRNRAYAAGNLQSDDRQTVTRSANAITIVPADPEVIYIPVYQPREVVVFHSAPIWYYYPYAYPVYYYPYPASYSFSLGFFWGVTSYFSIGWNTHYVHVHHYTDYGHPYYLNTYYSYTPYYSRNHVHITTVVNSHDHVWQPSPRRGDRPDLVTVEGRESAARMTRTSSVERQPGGAARSSSADISRSSTGDNDTQRMVSASPSVSRSSGNGESNSRAMRSAEDVRATAAPGQSPVQPLAQEWERPSSSQGSSRPAPQGSTRSAPQSPERAAPQASTRAAPQASPQRGAPERAAPSGQSSSGESARASSGSGSRMTGSTRSGNDHGASSGHRQER